MSVNIANIARLSALLLALLSPVFSLHASTALEEPRQQGDKAYLVHLQERAKRVTIFRDAFGVPHIYARSDADAVFGLLYAQSEDDFPRIERNYLWAIGRLAEVEGESALFSDLRARLFMSRTEARAAYAAAPAWLRALCDAFADGINFYLSTHPDASPRLISHFEPWMPMYFFEGSIGGDIEQVTLSGIEAFYGSGAPPARDAGANHAPGVADSGAGSNHEEEPRGSNGIAIAGQHSRSGNPLLLINPHTSFYFRGEVHVVSEEGLNAYGAVTWGQFFVYQGFNEHTGWMHTSTGADFMDEFIEEVSRQGDRLVYRYGKELREVEARQLQLSYLEDGKQRSREFTVYRTHHGPVTHSLDGKWVATRINWNPVKALTQSYLRTKQRNHAGFRDIMSLRTNSSNNTVYADADGTIAYYHGNFMPRRDPGFDYARPVDGSNPATDWQGLHSLEETIQVVNPANGWLQNCNSTPFTAAGQNSPRAADYPAYMAPDAENFRGLQAVRLLSAMERSGSKLDLEGLIKLAYDPYLVAFEWLVPGLLTAWDSADGTTALPVGVIEALRGWDYRVSEDSVAMTLGHFYAQRVLDAYHDPSARSRKELLEWFSDEAAPEVRLAMLAAVVDKLEKDFGHWAVPWGDINRFQRLDGAIDASFSDAAPSLPAPMASGRWGALASFGAGPDNGTRRIYGNSGNSFVAVVEFGERVRAMTLLAGGQSGDRESPHFFDQGARYVQRQFKPALFYREDVETAALRRYHPGQPHRGQPTVRN
jgi:acyl-homoserine lactone acylase PvdQ